MSLIVETKSKQEEKVLKAFLDSLSYTYQPYNNESDTVFLAQYNYDLAQADAEIDEGNYLNQQQVEQLFNIRRNEA